MPSRTLPVHNSKLSKSYSFKLNLALALAILATSACAKKPSTERIVDSCIDVPAACKGSYSSDGQYLAFLSPVDESENEQVLLVDLKDPQRKSEIISKNEEGELANGRCTKVRFLKDDSIIFKCKASNLLQNVDGEHTYQKGKAAPISLYKQS